MKIRVEKDMCCGAGQCVALAPEVFDQDDDGVVMLLQQSPASELHGPVRDAADVCPTMAIEIDE
ncbi:ferredoxin [Nocardiopsis gilva YIM 90087]|uniref:Ferredoxin n=1 Tax=Nocardiopsis gilva YIM 90087 TaxID=1235441 RepID=A0A223SCN1_9ACTN|nr:ferredoxin [Nocardiopsis gilva]ASU85845.1 ferredoxin [Nocardiopsis gilva YIM 90087]